MAVRRWWLGLFNGLFEFGLIRIKFDEGRLDFEYHYYLLLQILGRGWSFCFEYGSHAIFIL